MAREETMQVPKWFLENIENTLRIQNNINLDKRTGETCQDRNVREVLNGLRKILSGEELTGMERLEKLRPELPNPQLADSLDEAAKLYGKSSSLMLDAFEVFGRIQAFKAGAEWIANQGETIEGSLGYGPHLQRLIIILEQVPKIWDGHCQDVIIQIRKK